MTDENISNVFDRLSVSGKTGPVGKQRFTSTNGIGESQQRDPLKLALSNLQIQQNPSNQQRAPSMLIRKASMDRSNRIPSVVRKPSMDRLNSVNGGGSTGSGQSGVVRKASVDLNNRAPTLIRKGSLDGLSVNLNTKRVVSSSSSSSNVKALNAATRKVDIGTYDGSLERDEKRGRRSNDVRGGLLDLDARQ